MLAVAATVAWLGRTLWRGRHSIDNTRAPEGSLLMTAVGCGALLAGWQAVTLLFAAISFIALREFLTLAPTRRDDRIIVLCVYASVPISYWSIWVDNYQYFLVIAPIYIFVATATLMSLVGRTDSFLATVGIMQWGVIVCVYNLGHAAFLMRTPPAETPSGGPVGLLLLLIATTLFADALHRLSDHWGRRKLNARVSDATWEGLALSCVGTGALFALAAPRISAIEIGPSIFVGTVLPIWGAFGRLTMAAVKRDLGVAQPGQTLPRYGPMLDRVASLSFTAPWFFHMHAIFALERF